VGATLAIDAVWTRRRKKWRCSGLAAFVPCVGYGRDMPSPSDLDGTDHEIIDLLERDARRTLADIGKRVSLSAPAVKRRIDRLERLGIIIGYTIQVDHAKLGRPLEAFTELLFTGSTDVETITATAAEIPEVEAVFTTAGDRDALVWLRARDMPHLQHVIDQLRRSGRVTGTKTLMVLAAWSRHEAKRKEG
jgi:Lrp/AsnC family transcriptional regulator, leucine-responsive regulatory protein